MLDWPCTNERHLHPQPRRRVQKTRRPNGPGPPRNQPGLRAQQHRRSRLGAAGGRRPKRRDPRTIDGGVRGRGKAATTGGRRSVSGIEVSGSDLLSPRHTSRRSLHHQTFQHLEKVVELLKTSRSTELHNRHMFEKLKVVRRHFPLCGLQVVAIGMLHDRCKRLT